MQKTLSLLAAAIFYIALSTTVTAQTPVASAIHFQHTIESKVLGETRSILVHVPPGYGAGNARYPVVYMTDAHGAQNPMMVGIVDQQAASGTIPNMIIVGIQNIDRSRDLTPTNDGGGGRVGGGAKFLKFIETEVIPVVEANYRTEPYRVIAGHSLGGLFAIYTFVERPELFNAYIAASPVLHWDDKIIIKRAAAMLKEPKDWKKSMFVSIANEPDYVSGFNDFQDTLRKSKPKSFEFEFRQFKEDNHGSGVLPAYLAGLRKVYEGWQPPPSGTIADLDDHYRRLSSRFGYRIPVPEDVMNRAGYGLLGLKRFDEAISAFKRNVETYPQSANVYDSLADAYETNGQLKLAAENYKRSIELATAAGDSLLAAASKRKYDAVLAKMK